MFYENSYRNDQNKKRYNFVASAMHEIIYHMILHPCIWKSGWPILAEDCELFDIFFLIFALKVHVYTVDTSYLDLTYHV